MYIPYKRTKREIISVCNHTSIIELKTVMFFGCIPPRMIFTITAFSSPSNILYILKCMYVPTYLYWKEKKNTGNDDAADIDDDEDDNVLFLSVLLSFYSE